MKTRILWIGGAAALMACGLCVTAATAGVPGEQWSITTTMTMTKPMQMTMPSMTATECRPAKQRMGPPPMKNTQCKVTHWSRSGKRLDYTVSCSDQSLTLQGKGWTEVSGDSMKGHMTASGTADSMSMAMTTDYSGKRIGTCTAKDPD